jgi:uncharacterized paraquat-inducible protein A
MVEQQPHRADDEPEKPPRGVRTMAIVRWVILALAVLAAAGAWWSFARAGGQGASQSGVKYQCAMHPQIVQDTPGDCPICHMTLSPVSPDRLKPAAPPASSAGQAAVYTCPMDPEVVSDKPGRCPKCNMDLVPKPRAPSSRDAVPASPKIGQLLVASSSACAW